MPRLYLRLLDRCRPLPPAGGGDEGESAFDLELGAIGHLILHGAADKAMALKRHGSRKRVIGAELKRWDRPFAFEEDLFSHSGAAVVVKLASPLKRTRP